MRTFETLASGKKLLTTNSDIRNYPFFDEELISVIKRDQVQIDLEFLKSDSKKINQETLEMLTLDSWLECLFIQNQDDYWKGHHSIFTKP